MFSIISSIIVAISHGNEIDEDGYGVLNEPSYLNQIIGCTFILECLAGLIWIIRKVVKH